MVSKQQQSKVAALFKSDDATISAEQLAAAIGRDAKVTRAWLRRSHTRSSEAKGSSWHITKAIALSAEEWAQSAKSLKKSK